MNFLLCNFLLLKHILEATESMNIIIIFVLATFMNIYVHYGRVWRFDFMKHKNDMRNRENSLVRSS